MSWQPAEDPKPGDRFSCNAIETLIIPRSRDIGSFEVRRALPSTRRQMVGPFIFFDQMGPGEFLTGRGLDVRPHPHIGLATVTYLFDGSILHRDSLGTQLPIVPGDVNWMTAGSGIAHSERTDAKLRTHSNSLFGIQSWVALPKAMEEMPAAFAHHGADSLPVLEDKGVHLRLIAGEALLGLVWAGLQFVPSWGAPNHPPQIFSDPSYLVGGMIVLAGLAALMIFLPVSAAGDPSLGRRPPARDPRPVRRAAGCRRRGRRG